MNKQKIPEAVWREFKEEQEKLKGEIKKDNEK